MQNSQIRYISHPSYQNPNQYDTVVTREHTEVIRDKWRRIIADLIEERQEKPEPKGEKPKTTSDTKFENPLVFLTKIRKPKAKERKIRIPK